MDTYFAPNVQKNIESRKGKERQTTINEAYKKELREKACMTITDWMYDAAIPFNIVNYSSFKKMLDLVGQYGIGLKGPSYHEVRVPFLKKAVDSVANDYIKSCETEWAKYGCSLMADGWTDKRHMTLINFLVNSPKGSIFIKSVDASDYAKTGEKIFQLLDRFVERVGEATVVQVVTDSVSNNVLAGKLLEAKRSHLYWTPCDAHCVNLILEDIGELPDFKATLKKVMSVNTYIYVRPDMVNMLSASGCERNWSVFEQIHSKKRKQRLNDLVFVKYNRALKLWYDARDKIDLISLTDIDDSNEWLMGKMDGESDNEEDELIFEGDDLTWDVVARASGAEEPEYCTRGKTLHP
ncbi:uncharacterized protein LOC121972342 [Zingiber officinale]|uniref:uncharacterized protein LOC121972342 n=1 Tax=Zingiber officinale TaxID=94328 RepID=UPI001C4C47A8|nr:uncharacterized protein LOC121972342 [Zingiber officinale]